MIYAIAADFDSNQPEFVIASSRFPRFYAGMRTAKPAGTGAVSLSPTANVAVQRAARRSLQAHREEQQTKAARVAVILSLFLALVAATLLVGGRVVIDPMLRAAAEAREAHRVGDVVFTMPDGAFCRHLSFDNKTAEIVESTSQRCPEARPGGRGPDSSTKGFAWGAN